MDAIDPDFYSIKGGGGALFREKIIACKARRVLWIMDQSKLVHSPERMCAACGGSCFAVPYVEEQVREAGFIPKLRIKNGQYLSQTTAAISWI